MQSSIIGKIEKAKRYAEETERITFSDFSVKFRGDNSVYTTSLKEGKLHCTCPFHAQWKICAHTMAMEKILDKMLPEEARSNPYIAAKL